MAEKDSGDGPSLEMPSLGSLLRRKKARGDKGASEAPGSAVEGDPGPSADASGEPSDDLAPSAEEFDAIVRGKAAVAEKKSEPEPDDSPTTILDDVEGPPSESKPDGSDTTAVLQDELDSADEASPEEDQTEAVREPKPARGPRPRKQLSLPPLAARAAAAVTGAVVGLLAVALTYLALRGCEAVKGTSSCGSPGFLLLLAIMIGLIVIGSALLGAWRVPDASSTSFLAVGLLAVVTLLFLIDVIFSPWMILIIPGVSISTFCLSQWVTSLILDETD